MSKNIVKNDDMALPEKVVIGENWTGRQSYFLKYKKIKQKLRAWWTLKQQCI